MIKETTSVRQSGMGDPARGRGLPLKCMGCGHMVMVTRRLVEKEYQRAQEAGWDGSKIKET